MTTSRRNLLLLFGLGCGGLCALAACITLAGFSLFGGDSAVGQGSLSLTVINETGEALCTVQIKEASSQSQFGRSVMRGRLETGERYTIDGLAEGYYDIRAERCADRSDWYGRNDVAVFTEQAEWTLR